ncbi:MAG: hypothetical protein ACK4E7_12085 [Permianibacter sp.]
MLVFSTMVSSLLMWLTACFGLASAERSWSLHDLIHAAAVALYQAKANGRNQICERPVTVESTTTAGMTRA